MINKLIIHASVFHADDVFVAAMAKILNPNVEVVRTHNVHNYNLESDDDIVVCDIGGGRFDHHGKPKFRKDGSKHCAATLFWERFGKDVIRRIAPDMEEDSIMITYNCIDRKLLSTIAALDNGDISTNLYTINAVISSFNASWDHPEESDTGFSTAMELAIAILTNDIRRSASVDRSRKFVRKAIDESTNRIVVLPQYMPWQAAVCPTDALVVVFPSKRNGINVQLVPVAPNSYETKISTPKSWHGKSNEAAAAEFDGMTFCHSSGFMAVFSSMDAAMAAAKYLVSNQ